MAVIAQKRSVCEVCGQQLARPGWITPQGGRVCRQCVENCEVCGQLLARPGWIKNTTGGRICLECVEKKNKTGRKNVFVDLLPFPYRLLYTSIYGIYALAMWVTLLIIQFILVIFFTPIGLGSCIIGFVITEHISLEAGLFGFTGFFVMGFALKRWAGNRF